MVVGASSSLTYRQFSTSFITREMNAAGITTPVLHRLVLHDHRHGDGPGDVPVVREDEVEVLEVVGRRDHDGRGPEPLGLPGPLYRNPGRGRRAADDQGRLPLRDREVAAGHREPLGVGELVGLAHDT